MSLDYQLEFLLFFVAVLILFLTILPPFLAPSGKDDGIVGAPIPRYPGASLTVAGVPPRVAAFIAALAIFPPNIAGVVPFRSDGGTNPVSSARIGPGRTIGGFGGSITGGFGGSITGGFTSGFGSALFTGFGAGGFF